MDHFYCNFVNQTGRTWIMGVYQKLPSTPGLDSVSWLQSSAPNGGTTGVDWDVSFNVALGNYQQTAGKSVYKSAQVLPANLGTVWDVIVGPGGTQQLVKDTSGTFTPEDDEILILNQSGLLANPGIGMSGQGSVYKNAVLSNSNAEFVVTPTYWVSLFDEVELGDVISSAVMVAPKELKFVGFNTANLTASVQGATLQLSLTYSQTDAAAARLRKAS